MLRQMLHTYPIVTVRRWQKHAAWKLIAVFDDDDDDDEAEAAAVGISSERRADWSGRKSVSSVGSRARGCRGLGRGGV